MRNLKRALSLALAAVMLIGMMVVGTSAVSLSDFADAGDITHTEAATIINGLEIMKGDDSGFRPNDTITRAEMAIVILKMLYGSNVNASIYGGLDIFDDCDGHWAEPAINMAYTQGIVSGVGDGKFDPDGTLTVGEAATMVVKALGISCPGTTWPLNVMSKASELGLFGDMIVLANDDMSRDNIAVLCLEGLQYSPTGSNGYTVDGMDIVFSNFIEAYLVSSDDPSKIHAAPASDTLAKKVFGLTSNGGSDALGLPTIVWTATNPKVTITLPGAAATKVIPGCPADVAKAGLSGYVFHTEGENASKYSKDGGDDTILAAGYTTLKAQMSDNTTTYVYVSGKDITRAVVVTNYVGKVSSVTAGKNGAADTVRIGSISFEANGYEKGDYVLYNLGKDDEGKTVVVNYTKAQSFVGKLTRYTSNDKYTIDGAVYDLAKVEGSSAKANLTNNAGNDFTVYLDSDGKIVAAERLDGAAATTNYIYVLGNSAAAANSDYMGATAYTLQVTGITTDGVVRTFTVERENNTTGMNKLKGKVYPYTTKTNGNITLNTDGTAPATGTAIANGATSAGGSILNSQTSFIFVNLKNPSAGDGIAYSLDSDPVVQVGNSNLGKDIANTVPVCVVAKDGVAQAVYVLAAFQQAVKDTGNLVYLTGSKTQVTTTDGIEYNYTAYDVNGSKLTVVSSDGTLATGIYPLLDDGTVRSSDRKGAAGHITAIHGSVVTIDAEALNLDDEVVAYVKGGSLEVGQAVYFTKTEKTIDRLWVTEEADVVAEIPSGGSSVGEYETKTVEGDVKGSVSVGANGTLSVGGNVTTGAISTGNGSNVTISGNVNAGASVTAVSGSTVTIEGTVSGTVTANKGSTLTVNNIAADAQITVQPGANLVITGEQKAVITVEPAGSGDENKITTADIKTLPEGTYFIDKSNVSSTTASAIGGWADDTVGIRFNLGTKSDVTLTMTQTVNGTPKKYEGTFKDMVAGDKLIYVSLSHPYSDNDKGDLGDDVWAALLAIDFTANNAPISIVVKTGDTVLYAGTINPVQDADQG